MGAGSVRYYKKDEAYKKMPLNFQGHFFSSALLEVEQALRLHPAGIAQACDIGPRR